MNNRRAILIFGDAFLAVIAIYTGYYLRFWKPGGANVLGHWQAEQLPVFVLVLLLSSFLVELYNVEHHISVKEVAVRIFVGAVMSFVALSSLYYAIPEVSLWRGVLGLSLSVFAAAQAAWRVVFQKITNYEGFASKVLVLGTGQMAQKIGSIITATNHNNVLRGYLKCSDEVVCVPQQAIVGNSEHLFETAHREGAHKVMNRSTAVGKLTANTPWLLVVRGGL